MTTIALDPAADVLAKRGWTQGKMEDDHGRVCLTGALKVCGMQPGDWLIARTVLRMEGHGVGWNDAHGRTEAEVMAVLRGRTISDNDLAATFGPQWQPIVAVVRRAAVLTTDEINRLAATRDAARAAVWAAARAAAGAAAEDAAWVATEDAARTAAWSAVRGAARGAARAAAEDAAGAMVFSDLVGQHGLERHHIDTLLAPWIEVCGDPRTGR